MNKRVARLVQMFLDDWRKAGSFEAPGAVMDGYNARAIDAGQYGDPHAQRELPDEWKADIEGWQLLSRLRR